MEKFDDRVKIIIGSRADKFENLLGVFFDDISSIKFDFENEKDLLKAIILFRKKNDEHKISLKTLIDKVFKLATHCFDNSRFALAYEIIALLDDKCMNCDIIILKSKIFSICGKFAEASVLIKKEYLASTLEEKEKYLMTFADLLLADNSLSKEDRANECSFFIKKFEEVASEQISYDLLYFGGKVFCEEYLNKKIKKNLDNAIKCFRKVIASTNNPNDKDKKLLRIKTYLCLGKIYTMQYHTSSDSEKKADFISDALDRYEKAKSAAIKAKYPVWEEICDSYEIAATNLDEMHKALNESRSTSIVSDIMLSKDMYAIEKKYYGNESFRKKFIRETHRLDDQEIPVLHVLQRWNSFTPVLGDKNMPSEGGGYYLKFGRKGIVIDPGFDFIRNFSEENYTLNDIDYIFISHAHNDHTADLESITSLLKDYNDKEIKGDMFSLHKPNSIYQKLLHEYPDYSKTRMKDAVESEYDNSPRRKKISIAISRSTDKKYSFLNFDQKSDLEMVSLITTPLSKKLPRFTEIVLSSCASTKDLYCGVLYSKHFDLISKDHCVGFFFQFGEETMLIYTGDTGFDRDVKKVYEALDKDNKVDKKILLAHVGGFKHYEKHVNFFENKDVPEKAFYDNHLGRHGLIALAELIKPDLCIISEFGEEFRGCRDDFANLYDTVFERHNIPIKFIPADINLKVKFDLTIETDEKEFLPIKKIKAVEENKNTTPVVKYKKNDENKS